MLPQIETILKLLKNADVEFIVIGGVAMVAHGSAHVTFDIDICYRRTKENITKVCEVLAPFQVKLRGAPSELPLPFRFDVETVRRGLNFTLDSDLGDIDCSERCLESAFSNKCCRSPKSNRWMRSSAVS
jgi:hypothetical protein